jgi:hypothetical protein
MDWRTLAIRAGKVATNNSPAILTAIGTTGVLTTAVLAGRATIKAAEILAAETDEVRDSTGDENYELSRERKFDLVWKEYIPAAGVALLSIACIVAANRIGAARVAAMATAYNIADRAAIQYKDKVFETLGAKKSDAINTALAQDEINAYPVGKSTVYVENGDGDLFRDSWSGRYFNSSKETLLRAMNAINYKLNNEFSASLSDFYDQVGLDRTDESDYVGWTSDNQLDLQFSWASTADDRPCGVVRFQVKPTEKYASFH